MIKDKRTFDLISNEYTIAYILILDNYVMAYEHYLFEISFILNLIHIQYIYEIIYCCLKDISIRLGF